MVRPIRRASSSAAVTRPDQLVPADPELVHGLVRPTGPPRGTARSPPAGPAVGWPWPPVRHRGLGDVGGHRDHRDVPLAGQVDQSPPAGDHDQGRPRLVRPGGRLQRLFGVAGEGDGEDERAGAHEVGGLVALDHGHRHRHERGSRGHQHVTGDAAAAHAEDHHVLHLVVTGQAGRHRAADETAAATCSGRPAVADHMSRLSRARGDGWAATPWPRPGRS